MKIPIYDLIQYGEFPIDEDIIPLLIELHKMGLRTTCSCSGHLSPSGYGVAYITFQVPGLSVTADIAKETVSIYWDRFNLRGLQTEEAIKKQILDTEKKYGVGRLIENISPRLPKEIKADEISLKRIKYQIGRIKNIENDWTRA
jgi:hypothetical protein